MGDLELKGVFRLEAVQEPGAEFVVGRAVFGREDGRLSGEAVAEIVQADALPTRSGRGTPTRSACRCFRISGIRPDRLTVPGVAAICFELFFRDNDCSCAAFRLQE